MDPLIQINRKQLIVAVLTEITVGHGQETSFGSIHAFCEELNQLVTEAGGLFYVFALKDFSTETIQGFYFDGECWKKAELPLPHAIYNRIHSRRTELGNRFAAFLQAAEDLKIKVFNRRFLTKWEVHRWLAERKNLLRFLPETYLYSENHFTNLHAAHDELYLKPITGSQGRGIIWLNKNAENHLEMTSLSNEGMEQRRFSTTTELHEALDTKIKKRIFLIQQGIPLLTHEGKRLDFRVLCHQSGKQQWTVTSIVARLSAENQFASNLALGGEILRPLSTLSYFFGKEAARLKLELMKDLALECADCITENVSGLMVELGIDIGVDQDGELWVIEVNSKPSKNMETRKNSRVRPSAKAIIEFCQQDLEDGSEGERL